MNELHSVQLKALQGCSRDSDSYRATREVLESIDAAGSDLNFLFVSSRQDLDAVARAWRECGAGPTMACTTAGEVGAGAGYVNGAVVGASLAGVRASVWPIRDLSTFDLAEAEALCERMRPFINSCEPGERLFAIVLLDGLSQSEERVVASLHHALGDVPMVGGSAGDDLAFERTGVFVDGAFESGVGAVALVSTRAPAMTFMKHHFEPNGETVVVTEADPTTRRVMELDGMPAAEAYRSAVDACDGPLTREAMSMAPLMVEIGGDSYVRSLAGETGSALDLFCAIEEGLVLDIGRPTDQVGCVRELVDDIRQKIANPQLVLGFDCILRRCELEVIGALPALNGILDATPFVGFSTYGEVINGLHVNQTLTGIVFGR